MIPKHYPVTMVDTAGREYDVHSAAEYVSSRFKRGHEVKPEPKREPVPAPVVTPAAPPVLKKET
jgi:hypothetical protein